MGLYLANNGQFPASISRLKKHDHSRSLFFFIFVLKTVRKICVELQKIANDWIRTVLGTKALP